MPRLLPSGGRRLNESGNARRRASPPRSGSLCENCAFGFLNPNAFRRNRKAFLLYLLTEFRPRIVHLHDPPFPLIVRKISTSAESGPIYWQLRPCQEDRQSQLVVVHRTVALRVVH